MFENDLTLVYGFLIGMGIFVAIWFAVVVPSERRDHQRRLEILQKRIAEREQKQEDMHSSEAGHKGPST